VAIRTPFCRASASLRGTDSHVGTACLLGMTMFVVQSEFCHCEERSDVAIRTPFCRASALLRGTDSHVGIACLLGMTMFVVQ